MKEYISVLTPTLLTFISKRALDNTSAYITTRVLCSIRNTFNPNMDVELHP